MPGWLVLFQRSVVCRVYFAVVEVCFLFHKWFPCYHLYDSRSENTMNLKIDLR